MDGTLSLNHHRQHFGCGTANGCQHLGHAEVLPHRVVLVDPPEAHTAARRPGAPPFGARHQGGVVAQDGSTLAHPNHLLRTHGDYRQGRHRTNWNLETSDVTACSVGFTRILAEPQAALFAQALNGCEVARRHSVARRNHDAHHVLVRFQAGLYRLQRYTIGLQVAVDGDGPSTRVHDGISTRCAGEGWHQDMVAGLGHAKRLHGTVQRRSAALDGTSR
mmetsp:Transcript_4535/g.7581  ORF Transcript_4535/g.7581 Transcript_4535/m.7581 type:complete len:219 (-) Transcript_4535:18-674(-)